MGLEGKVVIITGSGQGIGKAIALLLAEKGANIAVTDIDIKRTEETLREIESLNRKGLAIGVDVTNYNEVEAMVKKVVDTFGVIHILVNNAGIIRDSLIIRMKEEDWDAVLDVNLKGTFNCTKAVLKYMTKQRDGRIVNIASIVGVIGNPGQANYVASKAGIIGFTKSVAREYASRGITANAVAPGFIDTAMTQALPPEIREKLLKQIPIEKFGTPLDVAQAVRFLVSDEASYITGQVIHVNGGMWM